MRREDDARLWDLLGQANTPAPSPFFARNVLRSIRQRPTFVRGMAEWFRIGRLVPAATVAMAVIVMVFVAQAPTRTDLGMVNDSDPVAKIDPQDYEVVADLDELVASDENALWDENSSL